MISVPHPESESVPGGGAYLKRGPLLFALSFPYDTKRLKEHGDSGFFKLAIDATDRTGWDYLLPETLDFKMVNLEGCDELHPWSKSPIGLQGCLLTSEGKVVQSTLIPEGCTVLKGDDAKTNNPAGLLKEIPSRS